MIFHPVYFFARHTIQICVRMPQDTERGRMKLIKILAFAAFLSPFALYAAPSEFTVAAQLLAAAKSADIQQVQILVNNGANINYVDNTGLSLVCTALMNNDLRAAQILQMYGADASQCDRQIKDYKSKNVPARTGGLFSGLSTAQGLTLAAAGAAVIVGGAFLLTDVFDPDNDNNVSGGSSGGGSSGGGGSSTNSGTAWVVGALPYGPAMPSASTETANYQSNLNLYRTEVFEDSFQLMSTPISENYLLLMRGYSPLARGYLGMQTLRRADNTPIVLNNASYGSELIEGGRPVNVALVTANGVNATTSSSLGNKFLVWTGINTDGSLGPASQNTISSKYYNNDFVFTSVDNYAANEDSVLLQYFDLSNSGTAIHNTLADSGIVGDDILAKIVGGNTPDEENFNADFIGFMPNGQMTIYRTGNGKVFSALASPVSAGTYTFVGDSIATGDILNLFGYTLTATVVGNSVVLTDGTNTYNGYIGTDDLLYMDSDGDGVVDTGFSLASNVITKTKVLGTDSYLNYEALYDAVVNRTTDASSGGRSRVDVIANLDVIEPLHSRSALIIDDIFESATSTEEYKTNLLNSITNVYSNGTVDSQIGTDAGNFFRSVGNALAVFSTGASQQITGSLFADTPQIATIENGAPLVYSNLNHSFMSVVAVGAPTINADGTLPQIVANSDSMPVSSTKYQLAKWGIGEGDNATYYKSRICGMAGTGNGNIDPWCFAAVGVTDEMATAAAAGAAGVLRSAFYYMTPQQIFTLLALTADGPFLGRKTGGEKFTETTLISHLQEMYTMPNAYQIKIDSGQMTYIDAFKQVFGYGVINLERATTPGTNLYFYSGSDIVSTSGNGYWRAATNTGFRPSAALSIGRAAIDVSAYDVLESSNGEMRLPRIWKNTLSFNDGGRHGLYMGDVLGDLRTRDARDDVVNFGNMAFSLTRSERQYNDNMGGLDNMRLDYSNDNWNLMADYQRYLTDGESRFIGMSNPILSLASNAMTTGAHYKHENWSFGARAFSGYITDEGLVESDPTISSVYEPVRLGTVSGAQSEIGWGNDIFGLKTAFGMSHENNTVLGAYGTGLMEFGGADTNYVDVDAFVKIADDIRLRGRATFAHTVPNLQSDMMIQMTAFDSNAFALGMDFGNLNVTMSMPLATVNGKMKYAWADYDIVTDSDGRYDLAVSDYGVRDISMAAHSRELRIGASYRRSLGEFTDGAIGFIYRINPNNIRDYGNESIFMLKLTHEIGI